jgi:signal transduction histidine kinase
VRVALARENGASDGARRLVLTVEDDGSGIDPGDLPRLFEPYFSKKDGGVGLGLAMVKRIVEDHGGRVAARNRADGGPGALFTVSLPVPA